MPPKEQRGQLGRILVIGVYVIALSYLVIVGFVSVIPQVFLPNKDESFDVACDEGLRILYEDLDHMRVGYVSSNVIDPAALRAKLRPWDLRLNALRDRCNETKVNLLSKYRYRVELNLQEYMREDAPLAKTVAEAVGAPDSSSTANRTDATP